jgi:hypothetical protein
MLRVLDLPFASSACAERELSISSSRARSVRHGAVTSEPWSK